MKKSAVAFSAAFFLLLAAIAVFGFVWTCCRVYVPAGRMAIVTAKTGRPLPAGRILAEPGEKGVQRIPLAEGRHFLNPINNEWRIVPVVTIPAGKVGVVTSKTGKELAAGEILAPDDDSKGVWRRVLGPGTYRLNPEGYDIRVLDAINIPIGYAGVVTSLTGKPAAEGQFAGPGEKGVFEKILQPGLYYVTELQQNTLASQSAKRESYVGANADLGIISQKDAEELNYSQQQTLNERNLAPGASRRWSSSPAASKAAQSKIAVGGKAMAVASEAKALAETLPASGPAAAVAFGMNQFVQFPSLDGFAIMLDMTVEFELLPENIARIYMLYGDLPAVVSKIILPQILSVSRMKGSGYKAREFIDGEGRQKFQKEMTDELVKILGEKSILVRNAIVRHVEVPDDILSPIQETSVAKERDLTNKAQQDTAKKQALLNTELAMVDQLKRETEQETEKITATIAANMKKDVATINAEAQLKAAEINLEAAKVRADITRVRGEAEAKARFLVENERALGVKRRADVFGDPAALADLRFVESLGPDFSIRVLHSGEGTLWTDLKSPSLAIPAK